jgi:hypothetical protein
MQWTRRKGRKEGSEDGRKGRRAHNPLFPVSTKIIVIALLTALQV